MLSVLVVSTDEVLVHLAGGPGPAQLRNDLVGRCIPAVVVLDVARGGLRDHEVTDIVGSLHDALPEARLLVLGVDGETGVACLRAGATGALPREDADGALLRALARLDDGRLVAGRATTRAVLAMARSTAVPDRPVRLTPTQERILDLMTTGATNRMIARRLGIAEKTVKNYATGIYVSLGVSNRTEAVARWTTWSATDARPPGTGGGQTDDAPHRDAAVVAAGHR